MKKLAFVLLAATLALASQATLAASEAQKAQQEKMKGCNAEAKTKDLKGDDRKSFMKGCLGGGAADKGEAKAAPNAQCEEKAVGKNGKQLAGAAKATFMKKCEADATATK
ncbi:MAG: phosphate starvation-inducible protein PsiF [Rhodocyclaceae bacterium]|nr:MAG: phosphate starvation-inducible protein PsiF [Rhodocyclaceae bacterium]